MSTADKVLTVLTEISQSDVVRANPQIRLFDQGLLDSFAAVEVMLALSEVFGVEISPAEFEPEAWATPAKIIAYMESRVGP